MVATDMGAAMHTGEGETLIECREISDDELIRRLREAAASWFNDTQLLLLEELIRRIRREDMVK
jgi:hypothetical protein